MSYLTEREIHVMGLQRCGQHGVSSWVLGHFNKAFFKNGITPKMDKTDRSLSDGPWWYYDLEKRPDFTWKNKETIDEKQEAIILGTEYLWFNLEMNPRLENDKKELANSLGYDEFSKEKHYIYVLRSPYNHLASWMKWKGRLRLAKRFAKCWNVAAEEFVGNTDILPHPKTFLNYDKWFTDKNYRKQISKELGLPFSDKGLNVVMRVGRGKLYGSSFDNMKYKKSAQDMNVTERWKEYKDNEVYLSFLKNDRLRELSEQIFGEYPL